MRPGVYILLLHGKAAEVRIGSLGITGFPEGYYAYVGSALGPGGLARVSRHIMFSRKQDRSPRWHIDHLLLNSRFTLIRAYCLYTTGRLECRLAAGIPLPHVPGFGSSDCLCASHLFYSPSDPDTLIRETCRTLGIEPVIHSIP